MRLNIKLIIVLTTLALLLAACNLPSSTPNAAATLQAVYTAQAATVQALQTQARAPYSGTATPASTAIFPTIPPLTAVPSLTPQAPSPQPTQPIVPTRTPIRTYCNWASFVKDVSIPDGTIVAPGEMFIKTWRLKNIGTCTWTTSYGVVFYKGNNMGAVATTTLPHNVDPGETVDISIDLTAPGSTGSVRGYWLLRNKAGEVFGLGGTASDPFYADVRVVGSLTTVMDFAESYCDATWRSGAGNLPCPGDTNSKDGYVIRVDNPQLENGQTYNGPALLTVPENTDNGYIQGYYPPFDVKKGDRFRARINCEYLANGCNALIRLDYQIGDGPIRTIWQFAEIYDGQYYSVDTDLSSLDGKSVKFIITVLANGQAKFDKVVLAGPRIERP